MTEYNEGDLVEAVKGETVIRGRATASYGKHLLGRSGRIMEELEDNGFILTVIEKAAPKNVLPTEPGIYVTEGSEVWEKVPLFLLGDQSWQFANGEDASEAAANWGTKAPLTKLEPVPVTAKKVIERFEILHLSDNMWLDDVAVISAEFGVSS